MPHIVKEFNYSDDSSEIKLIQPKIQVNENIRYNNNLTLVIMDTKYIYGDKMTEITPHEFLLNAF